MSPTAPAAPPHRAAPSSTEQHRAAPTLATSGRAVVATYLPGRRVLGVCLDERSVTVAVIGAASAVTTRPAPETAGERHAPPTVGLFADQAVALVPGASAAPPRFMSVAVGDAEPGEARVRARVDGSRAVVGTSLSVSWPMSVATVVAGVRRAVKDEVVRCTGLTVDHVDVEVVSLPAPVARSTSRVA